MRKNNRFTAGFGVYCCKVCRGRTRQTDQDAVQLGLCAECYELAGEDNMHNDDGTRPTASQAVHYAELLFRISRREGASVQRARDANCYCFPAAAKPRVRWNGETMAQHEKRTARAYARIIIGRPIFGS